MTDISRYKVGQLVELSDGRQCTIRFLGSTSFAPGDWVGVEFDDASGKNDGSVQGERYFDCDMGHGMFLRPAGVAHVLEEPTPKPSKIIATENVETRDAIDQKSTKPSSRPSTMATNGARRKTTVDPSANKRAAMNAASPTPGLRRQSALTGPKSPAKPTSRAVGSTATSSAVSSRGATPPNTTRKPQLKLTAESRSSLASRTTKSNITSASSSSAATPSGQPKKQPKSVPRPSSRESGTGSAASMTRSTNISSSRLSYAPGSKPNAKPNGIKIAQKQSSQASLADETNDEAGSLEDATGSQSNGDEHNEDPPAQEVDVDGDGETSEPKTAQDPLPSERKLQPAQKTAALTRKVEEYEAKLRILEKKRSDDVEKLSNLEKLQAERVKLERIIQTLQSKIKPQAQELTTARSKIKELEDQIGKNEATLAEHESEMEMAMLDREMAEETAEALKVELETLKQTQEEMELEVEVLREENAEFGKDVSPEMQSSRGWLQMERQNERYREALVRLRDVSQSTEAELKDQISALQEDLKQLEGIKEQYDEIRQQLQQSEAAIENLKQQLEAALASEDMVEELSEANNNLSEDNRKLKVEIDELQTINELNDEFELQRVENEKQMQAEIDSRGAALIDRANVALKQDEKLAEYEYTINRFRDVVTSLQSHIEDLKASQQISDAEADELNLRSKAMTELNMRLQTSAAKAQISTVDLEMRRLEAQEAAEQLAIVQMFLPDGFKEDQDSILVYLRFKRVSFKANLLCSLLKERLSGSSFRVSSEGIFVCCEIIDKLMWVSAICDRFVSDIKGCSLERFNGYERALPELDPVERALNGYIEEWKKDDMKERKMAAELQRTMALLTHLSEVHIENSIATYADDVHMRTALMQCYLETAASTLTLIKAMVVQKRSPREDHDDPDEAELGTLIQQLDNLISQSRSAKVTATKIMTSIDELKSRSISVRPDATDQFAECLSLTSSASSLGAALGTYLYKALDDASSIDAPLENSIRAAFHEFRKSSFPDSPKSSDPLATFGGHLRLTSSRLATLQSYISELFNTTEFVRSHAPWILRAEALTSTSLNNVSAEAEVQRLKDVLHERITTIRTRDQALEEQNVKIELLEARMRDANVKAKRIAELQGQAEGYKRREREMMEEVERKFREAEGLKVERDRWKATADQRQMEGSYEHRGRVDGETALANVTQIETLKMEIKGLQGVVRYLRNDQLYGRYADSKTSEAVSWLSEPLLPSQAIKEEIEKQEKTEREGSEVLRSLVHLAVTTRVVDLSTLPKNKLAWRPAREKSSWITARQSEDWEVWNRKRSRYVLRAREFVGVRALRT